MLSTVTHLAPEGLKDRCSVRPSKNSAVRIRWATPLPQSPGFHVHNKTRGMYWVGCIELASMALTRVPKLRAWLRGLRRITAPFLFVKMVIIEPHQHGHSFNAVASVLSPWVLHGYRSGACRTGVLVEHAGHACGGNQRVRASFCPTLCSR